MSRAVGRLGANATFASEVGPEGPVTVSGGRTHWDVGGPPAPGTRGVRAPSGVVAHEPAEMIVRVRAGTTLAELHQVVGAAGQEVPIEAEDPGRATVGGVLAVGRGGYRRLGYGHPRDAVLEVTSVSAGGELVRAGAPLVKNVTGFDLCRLLVGSLGTLALLAEVVLRCLPRPESERWYSGEAEDPFGLARALYRPRSVLWNGTRMWVCLAGFDADADAQARSVLGGRFERVEGPPASPGRERRSRTPGSLRNLPDEAGREGEWLAELGVGVVHCSPASAASLEPPAAPDAAVVRVHGELKRRFDPRGRLNPGRRVLDGAVG